MHYWYCGMQVVPLARSRDARLLSPPLPSPRFWKSLVSNMRVQGNIIRVLYKREGERRLAYLERARFRALVLWLNNCANTLVYCMRSELLCIERDLS